MDEANGGRSRARALSRRKSGSQRQGGRELRRWAGHPLNRESHERRTLRLPTPTESASGERWTCHRARESCPTPLAEPRLERGSRVGFFVAVFDDHGRLKRNALVLTPIAFHCSRTGNDNGVLWDDQTISRFSAMDGLPFQIVYGRAPCKDHSGADHRAFAHDGSLVHAAVSPDHDVVFDHDWGSVDGFEHPTQLRRGAQMHALTNLSAGTDKRV